MSSLHEATPRSPGDYLRAFRSSADLSLDDLADRIERAGYERPSLAKLSRIETGLQPVPDVFLAPLVAVTRIPARMLRPDLAKLFETRPRRRAKAA